MKQSKYSIPDYWRSKIYQNEEFWVGLFENQPIKPESVIVSPVILNSYSNQHENAWAVYPNLHSILGFLKFIYLPTAFIGLVKEKMDYQYYFQDNLGEVLNEYRGQYPKKANLITKMEQHYYGLEDLWGMDEETGLEKLKQWMMHFNKNWEETNGVSLSFHVFTSPKEAVKYIIDVYEEDLGIDMLEEDLGITKNELLELVSDDIYQNDFLKRKFTDILTNRLIVAI